MALPHFKKNSIIEKGWLQCIILSEHSFFCPQGENFMLPSFGCNSESWVNWIFTTVKIQSMKAQYQSSIKRELDHPSLGKLARTMFSMFFIQLLWAHKVDLIGWFCTFRGTIYYCESHLSIKETVYYKEFYISIPYIRNVPLMSTIAKVMSIFLSQPSGDLPIPTCHDYKLTVLDDIQCHFPILQQL